MMKISSIFSLAPEALLNFADEAQRAGRAITVVEQFAEQYAEALDRAEAATKRARDMLVESEADTSDIVAMAYGFRGKKPTLRKIGLRIVAQGGMVPGKTPPVVLAILEAMQGLSDAGEFLERAAIGTASTEDPVAFAAVSRKFTIK